MNRRLRWTFVVLLVPSLLGAAYGASVYAMVGSLSVAHPERLAQWRRAAQLVQPRSSA